MTLKKYAMVGALLALCVSAVLTGCEKQNNSTATDTTSAQDDANAAFVINDAKNIAASAAKGTSVDRVLSGNCEHILRRDTTINSVKDTLFDIFFGDTNCACNDQVLRKGHILAWCLPDHYFTQGDTVNIGFINYAVNNIGITGNAKFFNIGAADSLGFFSWGFSAMLNLAYPSNGGTAMWTSARTGTLTKTGSVWYYSTTGSANGTTRKGDTFSITITSPLFTTALPSWQGGCQYIEGGQLTATVSSFSYPVYVTYGTALGNCNNNATATINGNSFSFGQL